VAELQRCLVKFDLARLFANSFLIAGVGVILRLTVSSAAAFSLSRLKPAGGRLIIMGSCSRDGSRNRLFVPLYVTIAIFPSFMPTY